MASTLLPCRSGSEVEKALIQRALEMCDHNQTKAAEFLRITRNTLLYRMDKYGLTKKR